MELLELRVLESYSYSYPLGQPELRSLWDEWLAAFLK